jgi:DNA-binding response OmpR family regulator
MNTDTETADIPFIFLTAKTDKSDFRTGMNPGADDYVTKPFDGFDLLKVVEMRLKKNEMMKSTYKNDLGGVNSFFNQAKLTKEK